MVLSEVYKKKENLAHALFETGISHILGHKCHLCLEWHIHSTMEVWQN